jgi:hypothetical protein
MPAFLVVLRARYELFFTLNGHDLNTNEIIQSDIRKKDKTVVLLAETCTSGAIFACVKLDSYS